MNNIKLYITNNNNEPISLLKNNILPESAFWVHRNVILLKKSNTYVVDLKYVITSLISIIENKIFPYLLLNGNIILENPTLDCPDYKYDISVENNNITISLGDKVLYKRKYDNNKNS